MPRDTRIDDAQGPGAHRLPSVCTTFKTSPEGKSPAGRIYMSRKGAVQRAAALPFLGAGTRVVEQPLFLQKHRLDVFLPWALKYGCSGHEALAAPGDPLAAASAHR